MTDIHVSKGEAAALVEKLIDRLQSGSGDVEAFIAAHPDHADTLRRLLPAAALLADLSRSGSNDDAATFDMPLGELGDFRLIREVGRGGMGVVYEAVQISLNRRVALKVLPLAATMDPRQLARFRHEAQAAALLHHGHIVPVYAVGCERGVHYYAMQLIEGQSLADIVGAMRRGLSSGSNGPNLPQESAGAAGAAGDLPPSPGFAGEGTGVRAFDDPLPSPPSPLPALRERGARNTAPVAALSTRKSGPDKAHYRRAAELVAQAADALEFAHSMGVVHRDVKPANLLLDAAGHLWVADFGLARFGTDPGLTVSGDLIGTLRYMSPEQALAKHGLVDHRTDVYSLGATLYELLTLRPAVDGEDKQEVLRRIAFEEPTPPRKLDKTIPAELETITLKCLAKGPSERYATAGELADDLRRWLDDRAIKAKPPAWREIAAKWGRRHKYLVRFSFAVMFVAVVALAVSNLLITKERNHTKAALATAEKRLAQIEKGVDLFAEMLNGINPRMQEKGSDPLYEQLRKKAERAAAALDGEVVGDPQAVARLQSILGGTLRELGSYELAVAVLEKARVTREQELGPNHADTLTTLHHLATAYRDAGRLPEAIRLNEQVWKGQVATLGADHPDALATRSNLALMYGDIGNLPAAIRLLEQIRNDDVAKLGADNPKTLSTLNNLAIAYGKVGRLPEAIQLCEQVWNGHMAKLGPDHADTLIALANLATGYWKAGNLSKAIEVFEQVRKAQAAKFGAAHPETLNTLSNLAGAYQDAGKLPEAIRLKEQVRDARVAKLGADHHETLGTLSNLALAYQAAGRLADATRLFEQARDGMVVKLGPDHPDTLTTLNNLARAYQAARKLPEAIQLYEQVRDARVAKLGADHPNTLTTLGNLAGAYRDAGRLLEAIQLYEQVRDSSIAKLGADHPRTLTTLNNLANAYGAAGRLPDAIPLFEQAAEGIVKRDFLHEHARLIVPNTIRALEADRQFSKAEVLQRRWLAHVKEKAGPESPVYAGELASLGLLLLRQEKWADAETTLTECLAIREKHQPDVWATFNTMSLLGGALAGQKKYAEAEPLLLKGYEGMKARAGTIPPQAKGRLREAVDRLIELNTLLEKPDEVAKWRKERESLPP